MTIEEQVFQRVRPDLSKLETAGFHKITLDDPKGESAYVYETTFMEEDFKAVLTIREDGQIFGQVIDLMTEEEYLPLRIPSSDGSYVSTVRYEYEELLRKLAMEIGVPVPFTCDQANRITLLVADKYGDVPDFPWVNEGMGDNMEEYGVFRVPSNQKWYGLIMYVRDSVLKTAAEKEAEKKAAEEEKRRRLEERKKREALKKKGLKPPKKERKKQEEKVPSAPLRIINVMNLKIDPSMAETLQKEKGIYPAYHMSAKTWISIPLDDTLSDERVMELIAASHDLVNARKTGARRTNGPKTWIIPANPKYYDIVGIFSETDNTIWKQGKGIQTGDICYMYVAVPYSAILYKVTVTKAYSSKDYDMDLMDVHIDERYDKGLCTLQRMKEYGVTTVRGPRFMPQDLAQYIETAQGERDADES